MEEIMLEKASTVSLTYGLAQICVFFQNETLPNVGADVGVADGADTLHSSFFRSRSTLNPVGEGVRMSMLDDSSEAKVEKKLKGEQERIQGNERKSDGVI